MWPKEDVKKKIKYDDVSKRECRLLLLDSSFSEWTIAAALVDGRRRRSL
jgi:hypothetical protein